MKLLTFIIIFGFSSQLFADNLDDSNRLFYFAEQNFPQYFSPSGAETFEVDYLSKHYIARYYKGTDTYIGTVGEDVYVFSEVFFNGLLHAGKIGTYIDLTALMPTIKVDTTLTPPVTELAGFEDGEPRPIACISGDDEAQVEFIENELWLATDNKAELDSFLARWNGIVLKEFKPADYGLIGISNQYLVRVDSSAADASKLSENLLKLDANSQDEHQVSSIDGLNLLVASAAEAVNGLKVGVNWVSSRSNFLSKETTEAPSGPSLAGIAYDPNAFNWPSHSKNIDSVQNIGVAEAWRALDLAGKLDNKIKIAILDMGFAPDADVPDDWLAISNVPFTSPTGTENFFNCSGGSPCPWHGTNVVSAAMAVPDNNYGSAGPAGPVGKAIMIFTPGDMFTDMTALAEARLAGAKIANMSHGIPVPWYVAFTVIPFDLVTKAFRASGMLLFAAAGNKGDNVDAEKCFFKCWEKAWHTPCENDGVICVGGIAGNSKSRAGNSNYGKEHVDIFAPFTLWLGPDPKSPGNQVQRLNGTSFSSPFAAGVAALVWAANPGASASSVEKILKDTAHTSPDDKVGSYVNALEAVQQALGNVPPSIDLFAHEDGDVFDHDLNLSINLSAIVIDLEDGNNCCTLNWSSNRDGVLGTTNGINAVFTSTGERVITVIAEDSGGARSSVSFTINVVNSDPSVDITTPIAGDTVFRDAPVIFRGTSFDFNEPDGELACSSLSWTSSVPGDAFPISGCEGEVIFTSNGARTLTLTGTDPQGQSGSASVNFSVIDPPPNLPPVVQVTSPENNVNLGSTSELLTFAGTATDPEGETDLNYEWTVSYVNSAISGTETIGNTMSFDGRLTDTIPFGDIEGRWDIEIRLNVSDPEGNIGTDFVTLDFVIIN